MCILNILSVVTVTFYVIVIYKHEKILLHGQRTELYACKTK